LERIMKNLTTQLRLASLLALILLACTATYGQLTPVGDSYTNTATPTTNYGAKTLLDVESTQTTFIQFNLESIPSGYTSADITKATLKLYVNAVTKAGSFNVDYVNGTWSESTITANLAPALGTTIQASIPLTTADKNQYILVDVTAAVQAWLSGTANDGIALVGNSPVNATFDSKESTTTSHPPELDIVFAGGGASGITGITTAAGSGLIGGGTSGTLNLSLTNTCAANQVLQYSGSAWKCAAAGTGTITGVTAGTDLTGGGTGGNVTLNLNTSNVPLLSAANIFTANQTVSGLITAGSTSGSTAGVLGESNAASGTTYGVGGYASSPSGYGIEGLNIASNGGIGIYGSATGSGSAVGVYGSTTSTSGDGIYGSAPQLGVFGVATGNSITMSAYGVYGEDNTSAGGGIGVYGTSPNGTGVYGESSGNLGVYGSGKFGGVYGVSPMDGVFGIAGGDSQTGSTLSILSGAAGDTGGESGSYVGVFATADTNTALLAGNNDSTGDYPTMVVENLTSETHNPVFQTSSPNTYSGSRHCTIDTSANLTCTGVVSGVVRQDDGQQTAVYAMQSAENWLEDAGSGRLSNGTARIALDSAFAQTVNAGVEYHVFLTPKGDSEGLYVSNETPQGFEVHEQRGGHSSIAFDYRIMAKRKGYENVRLEDLTDLFKQRAAPPKKKRALRPYSSLPPPKPKSVPMMPTPPIQPLVVPRPVPTTSKLEVNQQ
jgi:hypothetical protein